MALVFRGGHPLEIMEESNKAVCYSLMVSDRNRTFLDTQVVLKVFEEAGQELKINRIGLECGVRAGLSRSSYFAG